MSKPTLLVMAAGMGSRYGSLKQVDSFGPSGETIMDYSVYDAIRAGFGKIVFVIRRAIEDDFRETLLTRFQDKIEVAYVFQELDNLPQGLTPPPQRKKPWGTGHAVWVAAEKINEPFAVINADDYYGAHFLPIGSQLPVSTEQRQHRLLLFGLPPGQHPVRPRLRVTRCVPDQC